MKLNLFELFDFFFFAHLPFKCGNNGGWNCVPSDAKCVGKKIGGVARGALLSSNGRKPFVLWKV